jgi:hypothetical protein
MAVVYTDIYLKFGEDRVKQLAFDINYTTLTSGYLEVGSVYTILANTGANFTTVGASANTVGTVFTATSSTILPTWGTAGQLQRGYSAQNIIEVQITAAIEYITSLANIADRDYDISVSYQAEFVKYYTMYLLYAYNNLEAEGENEKRTAEKILGNYWGYSIFDNENIDNQDTTPIKKVAMSVSNPDITTFYDDLDELLDETLSDE